MDADRVLAQKALQTILAPQGHGNAGEAVGVPAHA
jgi:hypothetical protein